MFFLADPIKHTLYTNPPYCYQTLSLYPCLTAIILNFNPNFGIIILIMALGAVLKSQTFVMKNKIRIVVSFLTSSKSD